MDMCENVDTMEPDPGGGGDTQSIKSDMNLQSENNLAGQLAQLQCVVVEMKDGFTTALNALGDVQYGDRVLQEKVDNNKAEQEQQLADVVNMVLTLKSEFGGLVSQLNVATENQKVLQRQVEQLQFEKDILLEELETTGAINQSLREKYHTGKCRPNDLHRMNETSLGALLERARHAFNTSHNASDHDSGVTAGEVTPPVMSPIVQSYIAGLQSHSHDIPPEENYDSDSSLTQAANRSLDLSRSLGDRCAEITQPVSSEEENEDDGNEEEVQIEEQREQETEVEEPQNQKINNRNQEDIVEPVHIVDLQTSPSSGGSNSSFKRPFSPKKTPPHEKNTKDLLRTRIVRELAETERKYCNCLWTVLDHFASPLKQANLVAARDSMTMFPPCLTRMYEHHCTFLQRLEERTINWKWQGLLGDVLQRTFEPNQCDLLKQYETYISEFPNALQQVKKSMKNSLRFKRFIRKRQADPCCEGLDLGAYLLTPVQRIPRYVLLLKQLLKHTEPEHPDYLYIESVLQRLADFLTELNDSIQHSMDVVANDTTPKLKKKSRPPWRSTSISSFDIMHSSAKDNDANSGTDNSSVMPLKNIRLSRIPRDQRRHTTIVCPTESTPLPNNTNYVNDIIASPICARTASGAMNRGRDRTFAGTESNTLPTRKLKLSRQKGPKSGGMLLGDIRRADEFNYLMDEADQCERLHSSFINNANISLSNGEFNENLLNGSMQRHGYVNAELNSLQEHTGPNQLNNSVFLDHSYSNNNNDVSQYIGASVKSLPEQSPTTANKLRGTDGRSEIFKSMPGIPCNENDYGIYGDNDEDMDETLYHPSMVNHDMLSRKMQMLGINQRSKSDGDMLEEGSASPSQQQIAMSLAKSLTDERLNEADLTQIISSRPQSQTGADLRVNEKKKRDANASFSSQGSASTHGSSKRSAGQPQGQISHPRSNTPRPRSAVNRPPVVPDNQRNQRPQSAIFPNATLRSSQRRDNVWGNTSIVDSSVLNSPGLNATVNSMDRRSKRKKKKDKVLENLNVTNMEGHKKKGFKDSIKNIFFKKRHTSFEFLTSTPKTTANSKVVELKPESSGDYINVPAANISKIDIKDGTMTVEGTADKKLCKPSAGGATSHMPTKLVLSTYEDENGDPCSAV